MNEYPDKNDQTRNMHPTPPARVAMLVWSDKYAKQNGGSMEFYDSLPTEQKKLCRKIVKEVLAPVNAAGPELPQL